MRFKILKVFLQESLHFIMNYNYQYHQLIKLILKQNKFERNKKSLVLEKIKSNYIREKNYLKLE